MVFRSWLWLKEEPVAAKPQTPMKAAMHRLPTHAKTLTKSEMSRELRLWRAECALGLRFILGGSWQKGFLVEEKRRLKPSDTL